MEFSPQLVTDLLTSHHDKLNKIGDVTQRQTTYYSVSQPPVSWHTVF